MTLLIGGPSRALASIFGEENITLAAILAKALEHTSQLSNTFEQVKRTTAFARDTALFTKESVQVARNVRAIIDKPSLFSSYIETSWSQAFPDLAESIRNVEAVRETMGQVATGDGILVYDLHAFKLIELSCTHLTLYWLPTTGDSEPDILFETHQINHPDPQWCVLS